VPVTGRRPSAADCFMRLHTDFRDYYDHAVGYGIDERVHYNRFTEEVEMQIKSQLDFPEHSRAGLLGFCGRIHPFIEFRKYNRKWDDQDDGSPLEIVERFYAYNLAEYERQEAKWADYNYRYSYVDHSRALKLKRFFLDWSFESDEIFLRYKVPVWMIGFDHHRNKGLLNPRLKDFGFERIIDPLTAFQEISMYVANILVEQKETVDIEDKYRIEQHGFDLKKSFRKEKKK
jgi:hypothetical protein